MGAMVNSRHLLAAACACVAGHSLFSGVIRPSGWQPQDAANGSVAYSRDGDSLVVAGGIEKRERGWTSAKFDVSPGTWFHFTGRIATSNIAHNASFYVAYFDADGKKVKTEKAVSQWTKSIAPTRLHKVMFVPTNAVSASVYACLRDRGWASFDQISLDDSTDDWRDDTEENMLLNASFEEADLGFGDLDSWVASCGCVERSTDARHGSYSVALKSGTALCYGAIGASSLAVKGGAKLNVHASTKGSVRLVWRFVPSGGEVVRCLSSLEWEDADFELQVPPSADYASFEIVADGGDALVDSLYLGMKPYSMAKRPAIVPKFAEPAKNTAMPPSSVRDFRGVPTWYVGEKPVVDSLYTFRSLPGQAAHGVEYHQKVIDAGRFPIYVIGGSVNTDEEGPDSLSECLAYIDYQVRFVMSRIPDARFLVWYQQYPTWNFARDYPDELGRVEDTDQGFARKIPGYSYGSEIWSLYCEHSVRRFFEEMGKRPYADRIVGFMPGFGNFGENNYGHIDGKYYLSPHDFSPAMSNFFRKWLLREYGGDAAAFGVAWGRKGFNFAHAQVPKMLQRSPRLEGGFLSAKLQRQTIDYARCESFALLHRVDRQGWAAKQATGGRIFTASEIGYFYNHHFHRELMPMLTNRWIDAFGPAPGYTNRGPGDDIPAYAPVGSMKEHNKVYLFQADVRTHVESKNFGHTESSAESVAVLLREMGKYMTDAEIPYHWTFGKWYDDDGIYKMVHEYERLMRFSAHFPRESKSEIALVIDPLSLSCGIQYAYGTPMATAGKFMDLNRRLEWHHLGGMHDIWLLDDILKSDKLGQYKLVILHGVCALTDEQAALVRERLYRDGRTVVWMYAPPVFRLSGTKLTYSLDNASVAGFSFGEENGEWLKPLIDVDGREFGWSKTLNYSGLGVPGRYDRRVPFPVVGFQSLFDVRPSSRDRVVGRWKGSGLAAAAETDVDGARIVFWGSVQMEREMLASFARRAGVHLYTSRPAVAYFNSNIGCVHVKEAGSMSVSLPRKVEAVIDLMSGDTFAADTDTFTRNMAEKSTLLFYFGDRAKYSAAMEEVVKTLSERDREIVLERPKYAFEAVMTNLAAKVESGTVSGVDGAGFIRDWLFLGPLPDPDRTGFDTDYIGGESAARPRIGDRVAGREWAGYRFSAGRVRAIANEVAMPIVNNLVYYLYTTVISPEPRDVIIAVGSDDGEKTFVNGCPGTQMDVKTGRSCTPDDETAQVHLAKGENSVLLKVTQGTGNNGHAVRFLDVKTRKPITDLKVVLR